MIVGVQSSQFDRGYFHFRPAVFSSMLKSKCGNILAKAVALRINLNLDGAPITSKSHTHPSYSQTSRLLTSSLSLGVPVPRPTQANPTVMVIQHLGEKSIKTNRDIPDVLRHIIKNISKRLFRNILSWPLSRNLHAFKNGVCVRLCIT